MNKYEVDVNVAADRYEQLMELFHAVRIPADITSAIVLWQISVSTLVDLKLSEEQIAGWLKEWFINKRALEAKGEKIGEDIDDFLSSILKEEKPKE